MKLGQIVYRGEFPYITVHVIRGFASSGAYCCPIEERNARNAHRLILIPYDELSTENVECPGYPIGSEFEMLWQDEYTQFTVLAYELYDFYGSIKFLRARNRRTGKPLIIMLDWLADHQTSSADSHSMLP